MSGNHFTFQLVWRIGSIAILSALASYLWWRFESFYLLIPFGFVLIQIYGLTRYLTTTNRKMSFLIESIRNEDFSVRFDEGSGPASLRELHTRLNALNQLVLEHFIRHEEQEKYHRLILDQLNTGVLIYNRQGHVRIANPAARKLLNCDQLYHIRQVERSVPGLYARLAENQGKGRKLIEFNTERETIQIVMDFSRITLRDDALTLVTIQNIHSELDQKETDSWIKLIRVLTHEIMNTITPITSISETLVRYFRTSPNENMILDPVDEDRNRNAVRGLEVINAQSNDLMSFVQSYRNFLHIPEPDKTIVPIRELFEKVHVLAGQEAGLVPDTDSAPGIRWQVSGDDDLPMIYADEKQITQILVNLIKNALQSMEGLNNPLLQVTFDLDEQGRKCIDIVDNGPGIDAELRDQIFIPFYTTREKGTGIGLSLSKKIMQMHGGQLVLLKSEPFVRTVFRMVF